MCTTEGVEPCAATGHNTTTQTTQTRTKHVAKWGAAASERIAPTTTSERVAPTATAKPALGLLQPVPVLVIGAALFLVAQRRVSLINRCCLVVCFRIRMMPIWMA